MKAPESLLTPRLQLRKPVHSDAVTIFSTYASDVAVTRYLSWPRHTSVDHTIQFIEFSNSEWQRAPAGPYVIELRTTGNIIGSTGLAFETANYASAGYVLATSSWGSGYATEALHAVTQLALQLGVQRLSALVHVDHASSQRVMQKCGFVCEALLREHTTFPNLSGERLCDVLCYARYFG